MPLKRVVGPSAPGNDTLGPVDVIETTLLCPSVRRVLDDVCKIAAQVRDLDDLGTP